MVTPLKACWWLDKSNTLAPFTTLERIYALTAHKDEVRMGGL